MTKLLSSLKALLGQVASSSGPFFLDFDPRQLVEIRLGFKTAGSVDEFYGQGFQLLNILAKPWCCVKVVLSSSRSLLTFLFSRNSIPSINSF